jgi:IS605 OrfB family transposase
MEELTKASQILTMMNSTKKVVLDKIFDESKMVCQKYIDIISADMTKYKKQAGMALYSLVKHESFTARFLQDLCQKALNIIQAWQTKIKKCKARLNYLNKDLAELTNGTEPYEKCLKNMKNVEKTTSEIERNKPELKNYSLDIGAKFITFANERHKKDMLDDKGYDSHHLAKHNTWITITTLTKGFKLSIPYRQTKHSKKLEQAGFKRSNFIQYKKDSVKVVYKKGVATKSGDDVVIGCDTGIKKLCVFSNSVIIDYKYDGKYTFDDIVSKMACTRSNTCKFRKLSTFRTNYINWAINRCFNSHLQTSTTIKLEDLNMKGTSKHHKTKHWPCGEIKNKLTTACNERGIKVLFVDPKNTSRQCNRCKHIDKESRNKEQFVCTKCHYACDADLNAAINIRDKLEKRV